MANPSNFGHIIGHLATEPRIFENTREGQETYFTSFINISAQSSRKREDGGYYWDTMSFRYYFRSPEVKKYLESLTKGRHVAANYSLRSVRKSNDNGKNSYATQLIIDSSGFKTLEAPATQNFRNSRKENEFSNSSNSSHSNVNSNNLGNTLDISDEDLPF